MSWKKTTIGEHCTVTSSKRFHASERTSSGIPFYCSKEIIQKINGEEVTECDYIGEDQYEEVKKQFGVPETGDLLITSRGTYGVPYVYKNTDKFYFADGNLTWLKDFDDELNAEYLYYWIKSYEGQKKIDAIAKGTAQKAVPIATLKLIELSIPDIKTQEKIVDLLKVYDKLIENNQKQIKLLEEAAQRLYKEWFVDLRFPGYEESKIVDGVPQGWKRVLISDICETVGGGTPSTKVSEYYRDGDIRWVTPTDITRNKSLILLDTEKKITKLGLEKSSAKMVPPYTILMTSRASVGYFGICEHEVCTNQGFISCIPYKENVRYLLLYNLMNRVEEIRQKASGSTFLEISKKSFRELEIVLPDSNVLDMFNKVAIPYVKQIEFSTKKINQLLQARERLLPKLMNGEIDV